MNNNFSEYQDYFRNANKSQNPYNNMNFNNPTYTPQEQPQNLYDAYEGFIRGNMFPDLYNQYKIQKPYDIEPMNEQAQMLTYVYALTFATYDIRLYLDNFPDDKAMIELYNEYRRESDRAVKQYEANYGPILASSEATNHYPWSWKNSPWPWEQ